MRRLLLTVAAALTLGATAAPPASAEIFIAVGTGSTSCEISIDKERMLFGLAPYWHIEGITDCNRPIDQTAHAYVPNGWWDGGYCAAFTDHCYSGEPPEDDGYPWIEGIPPSDKIEYHVSLRAPDGQGWFGSPTHCSGIGTDNLKCVLTD